MAAELADAQVYRDCVDHRAAALLRAAIQKQRAQLEIVPQLN